MNIKSSILLRMRLAFLVLFILALSVAFKMAHIQLVEGEEWRKVAEEVVYDFRTVPAARGNIYSDNGSLLATSLPFYRMAFDPTVASDEEFHDGLDSLSHLLAKHFGDRDAFAYRSALAEARAANRQYLVVNRRLVNYHDKKKMQTWPLIRQGRHRGGIIWEKVGKRFRPFSQLGHRTVGFINENENGAGLEYSFNSQLRGKDGQALYQQMAGGKWKPVFDGTEVPTEDGLDIVTTLDINLQDVTESALLRALQDHEAAYGCAVVMEVETGEIKALSNLTRLESGTYRETFNYAVQGLTDPGSTFKLASIIALLEETGLQLNDSIDTGTGKHYFYQNAKPMRDHKPGGYGTLTVRDAFALSSNIAISKLVQQHFGHQPQRFVDYVHAMGLSQPTGFQLVGESVPVVKNADDPTWSGLTLPWMSIGYEVELTPLQILALFNAVANDGKMIQPLLVKSAMRANKTVQTFESQVLVEQIASEQTLRRVRMLLEEVVKTGTARNINGAHYSVAGKTGTTQKIVEGRYTQRYYTSFVGYFPADRPRYSCIVVVDDPKGFRQYGSNVAAPVFREVADKIYAQDIDMHPAFVRNREGSEGVFPVIRAGYRPELQEICNTLGISNHAEGAADWVTTSVSGHAVHWHDNLNAAGTVPSVVGNTLRDALYRLENAGLQVTHQGRGRVVAQSMTPGSNLLEGSTIHLTLE